MTTRRGGRARSWFDFVLVLALDIETFEGKFSLSTGWFLVLRCLGGFFVGLGLGLGLALVFLALFFFCLFLLLLGQSKGFLFLFLRGGLGVDIEGLGGGLGGALGALLGRLGSGLLAFALLSKGPYIYIAIIICIVVRKRRREERAMMS